MNNGITTIFLAYIISSAYVVSPASIVNFMKLKSSTINATGEVKLSRFTVNNMTSSRIKRVISAASGTSSVVVTSLNNLLLGLVTRSNSPIKISLSFFITEWGSRVYPPTTYWIVLTIRDLPSKLELTNSDLIIFASATDETILVECNSVLIVDEPTSIGLLGEATWDLTPPTLDLTLVTTFFVLQKEMVLDLRGREGTVVTKKFLILSLVELDH